MERVYAALDIGSHTVRSLVASVSKQTVRPLDHLRDFTRFALTTDYQDRIFKLDANSLDHVFRVIEGYAERFKLFGVERVLCGATGVFRKAQNGGIFLDRIEKKLGFSSFIATEKEEALWSCIGALQVLNTVETMDLFSSRVIFFDLGGSSTEVVLLDRGTLRWWKSFFIGAANLTRSHFPYAPANLMWIDEAKKHAERIFTELRQFLVSFIPDVVVGGGGTVATLGAIHVGMEQYKPYGVCGIEIPRLWIDKFVRYLASLSLEARKKIPGLENGREDVIMGGVVIISLLMDLLDKDLLVVTDAGFLEGVLIKAIVGEKYGDSLDNPDLHRMILRSLTWKIEKS